MTEIVTQIASLITALGVIFGAIFGIYRWYLKQKAVSEDMKKIKKEQSIECKALFACLDGLKQLGANGNVTKMHDELEDYLNDSAHD